MIQQDDSPPKKLREGFTTGSCATAAAKAALLCWRDGKAQETDITITLPKHNRQLTLPIHSQKILNQTQAHASIIKDAGDDPDVTHGAEISVLLQIYPHEGNREVENQQPQIRFFAGEGVGIVTKPGLPIAVGEPAINPVPRKMVSEHLIDTAAALGIRADFDVTIAIKDGERLAEKTWNPRLGIIGGLSVLGTSGIVRPFSCSAWIHAIHRGIDVARALGLSHLAASTGNLSEQAIQRHYALSPHALIDMGDFVFGMLKYLKKHPVAKLSICGGFGKMLKLAMGHGDLHSKRSQIDFQQIGKWAEELGADAKLIHALTHANSAQHVLELLQSAPCRDDFLQQITRKAYMVVRNFGIMDMEIEVMLINRSGEILSP